LVLQGTGTYSVGTLRYIKNECTQRHGTDSKGRRGVSLLVCTNRQTQTQTQTQTPPHPHQPTPMTTTTPTPTPSYKITPQALEHSNPPEQAKELAIEPQTKLQVLCVKFDSAAPVVKNLPQTLSFNTDLYSMRSCRLKGIGKMNSASFCHTFKGIN